MTRFFSEPDFFIIQTPSGKRFKEMELLLLSRSIPFTVKNDYRQKLFYIPSHHEAVARTEIQSYLEENRNWPPREMTQHTRGFRFSFLHIWVIVSLALFHWHISKTSGGNAWLNAGRFTANDVLSGDWWRAITALTLHVDDAHLFSNMAGLAVFVGGLSFYTGAGVSWMLVLISAMFGNYLNAFFSQTSQPSIGASTAVFAAVGLISVFGIQNYYRSGQQKRRVFIPLMAGFGIFAMLGTHPQTDVSAHLFGFLGALIIGLCSLSALSRKRLQSRLFQVAACILFCLSILGAWVYALG